MPNDQDPIDPIGGGGGIDPVASRQIIYPLDKRPIKVIDFYDPNQDDSLHAEWSNIDSAYDWLSAAIVGGYQREYRRFMFNLPAGNAIGNTLTNGSVWFPLSVDQRDILLGNVADLLSTYTALGCEFGIMAGLYIDRLDSNIMVNPKLPSPISKDDIIFFYNNWINWIDIGITSFVAYDGMDSNDTNIFPTLEAYSNLFWSRGFKVYGRGLPQLDSTHLSVSLLQGLGTTTSWSALRLFEQGAGLQNVTANAYEIFVDLHPNNAIESLGERNVPFVKSDVTSLLSRGFYVSSWDNSVEGEAIIMSAYKDFYPNG